MVTGQASKSLLSEDLDRIFSQTQGLWEDLRGARLFITGGTGFFGCWILESFLYANERLELGAHAVVLTRDESRFRMRQPNLADHSSLSFHSGDIRSFEFPEGEFSHVIHAAADASAQLSIKDPLLMWDTIVNGTRRALEFSRQCGAKKFLFASSGAVYGRQPSRLAHIPEDFSGAPDSAGPDSAYGEGKRAAELLCAIYASRSGIQPKIARCFAFAGPYLPLEAHYAIGNFIQDAVVGNPIRVRGDGTPYRSYLYGADLAVWLWKILFQGANCRPYNVGSEERVSVAELAREVAEEINPTLPVLIAKASTSGGNCEQYVPSTRRAREELGLRETVNRREAIRRTVRWLSTPSLSEV